MAESSQLSESNAPPGGGSSVSHALTNKTERPDNVPEKFWNAEKGEVDTTSLMESYLSLEQKMGSPSEESAPDTEDASTETNAPPSDEGFNLGKYEDEYRDNENSLKDETYTELQSKFGLSKDEVNKYIQYRQADADEFASEIFGMAGGEQSYQSMLGWASNNLPKGDIDQLNDTLASGDRDTVRVEVMKLHTKYREAVGSDARSPVSGSTNTATSGPKPFASLQEAVEARKDKRFELDPAYRQQWEQRVGASPFINSS